MDDENGLVRNNVPYHRHDYLLKHIIGDDEQDFLDLLELDYTFKD
ncbi:MAG: hypothetical protein Q4P18_07410 [Methanobrevibacter sp.]|nr:hypothetical protein [Methanobrevibacter sp.]MDO5849346.1 hypothetical protein [Methanobrevibacter sp.]